MSQNQEKQTSLRIGIDLLDSLMTLAGELVLSRNQLLQGISSGDSGATEFSSQRIDMITSQLQETVMRTRMQPLANTFNKYTRVVRDISVDLGKNIELEVEGRDVELDKTIIESINFPLEEIIKNAAEHGIESPEARAEQGKNKHGKIKILAFHDAGQVNINISDDGLGLDLDKISEIAVSKGVVSEKDLSMMTPEKKLKLIFEAGFSMSSDDDSSRGNGLDKVLKQIESIGGVIDISSKYLKGTEIIIKLPLTLAIIPSQIITLENQKYAIPQVNLGELIRIPVHEIKEKINVVGNAPVLRLRGELLPLVDLADLLGIEKKYRDPVTGEELPDRRKNIADRRSKKFFSGKQGEINLKENQRKNSDRRMSSESAINIAVVSSGTFKFCIIVKELNDSEEIVVKPLGRLLKDCTAFAGATIMGDGKAALILDIANLAQMAELSSVAKITKDYEQNDADLLNDKKDADSLLCFSNAENEYFAMPLEAVERIERIKGSSIEYAGGKRIVQYRGGTLPLYELSEIFDAAVMPEREIYEVIVLKLNGFEAGLMVSPPVDSVEVRAEIDKETLKQNGLKGSAIINEKTTLVIDPKEITGIFLKEMA